MTICQNDDFSLDCIQFESIEEKQILSNHIHIENLILAILKCFKTHNSVFYLDCKVNYDFVNNSIELIIREKFFNICLDDFIIIENFCEKILELIKNEKK